MLTVTMNKSLNLSQEIRAVDNSAAATSLEGAPVPGNPVDASECKDPPDVLLGTKETF